MIVYVGQGCSAPSFPGTAGGSAATRPEPFLRQRQQDPLFCPHPLDGRSLQARLAGISHRKSAVCCRGPQLGPQPFPDRRHRPALPLQAVPPGRGLPVCRTNVGDVQPRQQVAAGRDVHRNDLNVRPGANVMKQYRRKLPW